MDGVKDGGGGGGDDLLSHIFGFGGGRGGKAQQKKKAKPVLKEVTVTLDDVYHGKMLYVDHKRKRLCVECHGEGGSNSKKCTTCKGQGMVNKMMMIGPGMYTQSTQHCKDCKGEGKIIEPEDVCKTCKGEKMKEEKKKIEVAIEPGVPDDYDYILHGESDEYVIKSLIKPGVEAGDLYVRVKILPHKTFKRNGADLIIEKKITLIEALTGFKMAIDFFEGKKLNVVTLPGEVIKPGMKFHSQRDY